MKICILIKRINNNSLDILALSKVLKESYDVDIVSDISIIGENVKSRSLAKYTRYDLILKSDNDSIVEDIKQINPNVKIVSLGTYSLIDDVVLNIPRGKPGVSIPMFLPNLELVNERLRFLTEDVSMYIDALENLDIFNITKTIKTVKIYAEHPIIEILSKFGNAQILQDPAPIYSSKVLIYIGKNIKIPHRFFFDMLGAGRIVFHNLDAFKELGYYINNTNDASDDVIEAMDKHNGRAYIGLSSYIHKYTYDEVKKDINQVFKDILNNTVKQRMYNVNTNKYV